MYFFNVRLNLFLRVDFFPFLYKEQSCTVNGNKCQTLYIYKYLIIFLNYYVPIFLIWM